MMVYQCYGGRLLMFLCCCCGSIAVIIGHSLQREASCKSKRIEPNRIELNPIESTSWKRVNLEEEIKKKRNKEGKSRRRKSTHTKPGQSKSDQINSPWSIDDDSVGCRLTASSSFAQPNRQICSRFGLVSLHLSPPRDTDDASIDRYYRTRDAERREMKRDRVDFCTWSERDELQDEGKSTEGEMEEGKRKRTITITITRARLDKQAKRGKMGNKKRKETEERVDETKRKK